MTSFRGGFDNFGPSRFTPERERAPMGKNMQEVEEESEDKKEVQAQEDIAQKVAERFRNVPDLDENFRAARRLQLEDYPDQQQHIKISTVPTLLVGLIGILAGISVGYIWAKR